MKITESHKLLLALHAALGVVLSAETAEASAAAEIETPEPEDLKMPTSAELKTVLTEIRDRDTEVLKELLASFGAAKLKELSKEDWPAAYAAAQALLVDEDEDDDLDDDDLDDDLDDDDDDLDGDDDDIEVPDPEDLKAQIQAYAKANSKEKATRLLKKAGLNTVRGIKAATEEKLIALAKLLA